LIAPEEESVKVIKVFLKENWKEDDWKKEIEGIDL
jgi:hypothetical protein